jgi:hypothetical protein
MAVLGNVPRVMLFVVLAGAHPVIRPSWLMVVNGTRATLRSIVVIVDTTLRVLPRTR